MAGLVLSLKPYEKFLVNGFVLENGPKRGQIRVTTEGVNVLRFSDVIHPNDANTPLKRVYYAAQVVLSGDSDAKESAPVVNKGLMDILTVFKNTGLEPSLNKALKALEDGRYYSILCALKPLFPIEEKLLSLQNTPPESMTIGPGGEITLAQVG